MAPGTLGLYSLFISIQYSVFSIQYSVFSIQYFSSADGGGPGSGR